VENVAHQKQKITHLHYFIYTRTDAFISRKIFNFIAPKSAFLQASEPMFENPAELCNSRPELPEIFDLLSDSAF